MSKGGPRGHPVPGFFPVRALAEVDHAKLQLGLGGGRTSAHRRRSDLTQRPDEPTCLPSSAVPGANGKTRDQHAITESPGFQRSSEGVTTLDLRPGTVTGEAARRASDPCASVGPALAGRGRTRAPIHGGAPELRERHRPPELSLWTATDGRTDPNGVEGPGWVGAARLTAGAHARAGPRARDPEGCRGTQTDGELHHGSRHGSPVASVEGSPPVGVSTEHIPLGSAVGDTHEIRTREKPRGPKTPRLPSVQVQSDFTRSRSLLHLALQELVKVAAGGGVQHHGRGLIAISA